MASFSIDSILKSKQGKSETKVIVGGVKINNRNVGVKCNERKSQVLEQETGDEEDEDPVNVDILSIDNESGRGCVDEEDEYDDEMIDPEEDEEDMFGGDEEENTQGDKFSHESHSSSIPLFKPFPLYSPGMITATSQIYPPPGIIRDMCIHT